MICYNQAMPDSLSPNDGALQFFREVVEPTVAEFMADRADKRRGCLACLALASMTEHYTHARLGGGEHAKAFKSATRAENKAVGWISDVANATRHVIRSTKFEAIGYGDIETLEMGQCGVLRCGWPINGEEVLVGPEHQWRLSELIDCTMDFWRGKLGVGSEKP
jgi:hypothetical protein